MSESVEDGGRDWGIVMAALQQWADSFDHQTNPLACRARELAEQAMRGTGIFAQVVGS